MDISGRLKAQAEVNAYRRELSQTRRLTELGMMSKVLAKKLRKPLNVTQMLLQRLAVGLEKSQPDKGMSDMVEQSLAEVHEAFSTVKRFCDHVDIPTPQKNTVLDTQDFFTRIIAVFKERAHRVNLEFILDLGVAHLRLVIASKELQYIVSTLIEHILDRASQGATQTLTIQCQRDANQILILFRDTCRRLSEEEVKNAFVPFALKTSDTGQNELGLAVVQKITEENQGSITVHSQAGEGTLFTLALPTCPTHEVQT
jgi:signal transduction histidine kinase